MDTRKAITTILIIFGIAVFLQLAVNFPFRNDYHKGYEVGKAETLERVIDGLTSCQNENLPANYPSYEIWSIKKDIQKGAYVHCPDMTVRTLGVNLEGEVVGRITAGTITPGNRIKSEVCWYSGDKMVKPTVLDMPECDVFVSKDVSNTESLSILSSPEEMGTSTIYVGMNHVMHMVFDDFCDPLRLDAPELGNFFNRKKLKEVWVTCGEKVSNNKILK